MSERNRPEFFNSARFDDDLWVLHTDLPSDVLTELLYHPTVVEGRNHWFFVSDALNDCVGGTNEHDSE